MRFNYNEIKSAILEEWEEITESAYPEDRLGEMAEGFAPIYYAEIIKDWTEMPSEYNDNWKEHYGESVPEQIGITELMTSDVHDYYRDTTTQIYHDILKEKEDN